MKEKADNIKAGFIAIVGRPNAGKSSLMNAILGEKVSIVTPKPQTTRNKILGILSTEDYQMIFIDTPGIVDAKNKLGEFMSKAAKTAAEDVDVIIIVLDVTKPLIERDFDFITKMLKQNVPTYIVLNKTDLVGYEKVYAVISRLNHFMQPKEGENYVKELVPTSCRNGKNIQELKQMLISELPDGVYYYPPENITDRSERFMLAEFVREKALLFLQEEIPHGIGIEILEFVDEPTIVKAQVDIFVEKNSHKQIVIGKDGEMLKRIGESARIAAEKLFNKKVYIKLFVKVRENWRDKKNYLDDLGYDSKKNS